MQAEGVSAIGGGFGEATISPLALGALVIAAVLILLLPRKYVIVPVLLAVFLVPMENVLVVAGVHITPQRLIVLVGWMKKLSSKTEDVSSPWNNIDAAILCWASFRALAFILLWRDIPSLINQSGVLWSVLGMYFLLRFLIQNDEDIERTIKLLVLIAVVNGSEMAYEHFTGRNLFALVLGGVSPFSLVRDGTIRSQGAFAISILAGTFGATLVPLLVGLWKGGRANGAAAVGLVFASVMIMTTGSSTPILAILAAVAGLCLWPLRRRMRLVRWCIVGCLVGLQLVMKAPVWFILNHVNVIGGSSGYHRTMLVDNFVRNFGDWWLLGTRSTAHWGYEMTDLANEFVAQGQGGGILAFIFFILMIKRAFGALGTARKAIDGDNRREWLLWSLGATLLAYMSAFFGISLWDQTGVAWLALFAMICAATSTRIAKQNVAEAVPTLDDTSEGAEVWFSPRGESIAN